MTGFLQHLVNGLIIGGAYALIGTGMTLIFGIMRVVNFAHGELYMLGAYMVLTFSAILGINFFLSMAISIITTAIFGFLLEKTVLHPLRDRPIEISMLAMIGISIVLKEGARFIWTPVPRNILNPFRPIALAIGPVRVTELRIFIAIVALLLIVATHFLVRRTWLGKSIRATFQDKDIAALLGVRVDRIYSFTFAFGSSLAAVSGTLLGTMFVVKPTMGEFAIVKAFAVVILGGMGSFAGAIVGGLILGVGENLSAAYIASGYKENASFLL